MLLWRSLAIKYEMYSLIVYCKIRSYINHHNSRICRLLVKGFESARWAVYRLTLVNLTFFLAKTCSVDYTKHKKRTYVRNKCASKRNIYVGKKLLYDGKGQREAYLLLISTAQ